MTTTTMLPYPSEVPSVSFITDAASTGSHVATTNAYSQPPSPCLGSPTPEDMVDTYNVAYFWLEVVSQFVIGVAGFIANLVVIPILCCEKLRSIFNRLLATLVILDNCFIALSLVNTVRIHFFPEGDLFHVVGNTLLYPMRSTFLCCTINVAIALAVERYRAIRHPIAYYNANKGSNPWRKVLTHYLFPVLVVAITTNVPRFLEMEHVWDTIEKTVEDPDTGTIYKFNTTKIRMEYSELRFNKHYILWYQNVAKLLLTAVIPFLILSYLNANVYIVIRRRRKHLGNRFMNAESNAYKAGTTDALNVLIKSDDPATRHKAEAARQAYVLFAICFMFFMGHFLRIILDIHEFIALEDYHDRREKNCLQVPLWAMVAGSVSQVLLVLNSSVNFAIYCCMAKEFRQIFFYKVRTTFISLCVTLKTATSATSVDRPAATNSSGMGLNGVSASASISSSYRGGVPTTASFVAVPIVEIPSSNSPFALSALATDLDGAATGQPEGGSTEADAPGIPAAAIDPISDTVAFQHGTNIAPEGFVEDTTVVRVTVHEPPTDIFPYYPLYLNHLLDPISAAAENTMGKLQRVRCNSYSLGVSKVRDMFRSRGGPTGDGGGGSDRNSRSSSSSRRRQRTRSVRFSPLKTPNDPDPDLMTPNATDNATKEAVDGADAGLGACASPQVMEMSLIRAKSEPSGIAKVV